MPQHPVIPALASGVAGATLFLALLVAGFGPPFLLMPSFPLFVVGLRYGALACLQGAMAGGLAALVLSGGAGCAFFLGIVGLPSLLLTAALLRRVRDEWVPAGAAVGDLVVYAALVVLGMAVHFGGEPGGLSGVLTGAIRQGFADAPPNVAQAVEVAAGQLQFLIVAVSVWWWVLLLYAHAYLANWVLRQKNRALRPQVGLRPFALSTAWLGVLAVAAVASLTGDTALAFPGQIFFVIFLLPYCLLGITVIHSHVRAWPNRGLLLFVLYLFTLTQFWPALMIAGVGLWRQIKTMRLGQRY